MCYRCRSGFKECSARSRFGNEKEGREAHSIGAAMIDSLFDLMFRCAHRQPSRPMAQVRKDADKGQSFTVCLDCGARFAYDMSTMRQGKRILETGKPGSGKPHELSP